MPTSFKRSILISLYSKTPTAQLIFCDECGGLNAMGRVAVKVDCTACDTTGYSNYWTIKQISAYYIPGEMKRWDSQRGGYVSLGEVGLKVNSSYSALINEASFLEFNGIKWNFASISDPGHAFGQERLILALSRKE